MTTREIFTELIISDVKRELNEELKNITWPTRKREIEYCRNQVAQALGLPKEFLFYDNERNI